MERSWADRFNAKRVLREVDKNQFLGLPSAELGRQMRIDSLRSHIAPWKLPAWPHRGRVLRDMRSAWIEWGQKQRLHPRVTRRL
eukprot:671141-Pyramimonas_sp.AAC.1